MRNWRRCSAPSRERPCCAGTSCSTPAGNRNRSASTTCRWISWRGPPWPTPHASHGRVGPSPSWPFSAIPCRGWRSRSGARMPAESEARTLRMAQGVPVFAILRRLISGDAVLEVCRHIVIPADRVVLEYGIDVSTPAAPRDLADRCPCRSVAQITVTFPVIAAVLRRQLAGRIPSGEPTAHGASSARRPMRRLTSILSAGTGQGWRTRPFASASRPAGAVVPPRPRPPRPGRAAGAPAGACAARPPRPRPPPRERRAHRTGPAQQSPGLRRCRVDPLARSP